MEVVDDKKLRSKYNRQMRKFKDSKYLVYNIVESLSYEDLKAKVQESLDNGFKCCYCTRVMTQHTKDSHSRDAYAIDHIKPAHIGGFNAIENINICCHRCNIIKGTMDLEVFLDLIKMVMTYDEEKREAHLNQLFIGCEAREIKRYIKEDKKIKQRQTNLLIFIDNITINK